MKNEIPGILLEKDGISFSTHNLHSGDHFFVADDFRIARVGDQLSLLFGTVSSFSDDETFHLAIELNLPMKTSVDFLYSVAWEKRALNSEKPLVNVIEDMVNKDESVYGSVSTRNAKIKIPNGANYRKFPANFVTCSVSHGQALLEFFEVSPDTVVSLLHNKHVRPNSGAKNIVSVIMSQRLVLDFYKEIKTILEPFKKSSVASQDKE
ncbi:hypothetical protein DOM21_17395 [Bacteriovorax stolpii]|nr:hypothetical protein DOM21_17395 [Bacteriovorax stolpii]